MAELAIFLLDALPRSQREKILDHYDSDVSKLVPAKYVQANEVHKIKMETIASYQATPKQVITGYAPHNTVAKLPAPFI